MAKVAYKGLADARPPKILDAGEYGFRVASAKHGPGKSNPNRGRLEVMVVAEDEPEARPIFTYFSDPISLEEFMEHNPDKSENDWKAQMNRGAVQFQSFMNHFDIPWDKETNEYDTDDFIGRQALCTVTRGPGTDLDGNPEARLKYPQISFSA